MKYRIRVFDLINDIWMLQASRFGIFWKTIGVGSRSALQMKIKELEL